MSRAIRVNRVLASALGMLNAIAAFILALCVILLAANVRGGLGVLIFLGGVVFIILLCGVVAILVDIRDVLLEGGPTSLGLPAHRRPNPRQAKSRAELGYTDDP